MCTELVPDIVLDPAGAPVVVLMLESACRHNLVGCCTAPGGVISGLCLRVDWGGGGV